MAEYDCLFVGAGLTNAVIANKMAAEGFKCIVVEKRDHIGGNCATYTESGVTVHRYGAHIFHTSNEKVWEFVNRFADFKPFVNSPIAVYRSNEYHLPFNMNTFCEMWPDVKTPEQARAKIESQRPRIENPKNLEEQALVLVGEDIYRRLIKGYTEKQWGKSCAELPPEIIKRLPLRFTWDNNYFNDKYQGIPVGGYSAMIEEMLKGIPVVLNEDYLKNRWLWDRKADKVFYSGAIDEYYDYKFGALEYRSLKFSRYNFPFARFQPNAVYNFTDGETPYTRRIEHKHFLGEDSRNTIVDWEFPAKYEPGKNEPFYPVADEKNSALYRRYKNITNENTAFVGRLGIFRYMDMDDCVELALETDFGERE